MRILALLLLAPASLSAQSITPKFAWPVGSTAEVTITTTTSASAQVGGMPADQSQAMKVITRLAVEAHPEGLRVVTGPGRVEGQSGPMAGPTDPSQLLAMRSVQIITRDGRFARLDDTTALRRTIDSVMAPLLDQIRATAPQMLPMMQRSMSVELMRESAAQNWRQQVEDITSRSWSPGDSTTGIVKQPMPIAPGMTISVPRVLKYEGTTACPAGHAGTCWRFATRSVITREVMRGVMAEVMQQMGVTDPAVMDQLPIPETTASGFTIVDAATLRPLQADVTTRSDGSGALMQMSSAGTVSMVYRWSR